MCTLTSTHRYISSKGTYYYYYHNYYKMHAWNCKDSKAFLFQISFKEYDLSNLLLGFLQMKREKWINNKEHAHWNLISIITAKWYFHMQAEAVCFVIHSPLTYCHSFSALSSVELKITVPQVTVQYKMLPFSSQFSNKRKK